MKIQTAVPLCVFAALCAFSVATPARAQVNGDVAVGIGTATASATGQGIDTFGTGTLYYPPTLHGVFGKVSGDIMLKPSFGIGVEYAARFSQGAYAGINYRPSFYDFNAVYSPVLKNKRFQPEFQGGLGGMNIRFYQNSSACDSFGGCSSSNTYLESSNHLQLHGMAGVRVYVTKNLFIRPEVDVRYVHNLFQFGTNVVPEYGVSVGYSFGK